MDVPPGTMVCVTGGGVSSTSARKVQCFFLFIVLAVFPHARHCTWGNPNEKPEVPFRIEGRWIQKFGKEEVVMLFGKVPRAHCLISTPGLGSLLCVASKEREGGGVSRKTGMG